MMNAKTQIRKRVANDTLLENRIRLIFIHFCLFISITAYSQNTIKSIDGEDAVFTDRNRTVYNVPFFGTEESAFNSKNVFENSGKTEIIAIFLYALQNKTTCYGIFSSGHMAGLISNNQVNKNISKHFISHSYAVRPPPKLI